MLTTKNLYDIYTLGVRLLDSLDEKEMNETLYLFYHKIFVTYDFIYYSYVQNQRKITKGIFTHFEENRGKYFSAINVLKPLQFVKTSAEYRKKSIFIIQDVMRTQLGIKVDDKNFDKYENDFFKEYITSQLSDTPLEPLTYLLAHKLWKLNKMIQYRFEQSDEKDFDEQFKIIINNYIKEQLDNNNHFYSDKDVSKFALETYKSDLKLAEFIFEDVHHRSIDEPLQRKADTLLDISLSTIELPKEVDIKKVEEAFEVIHNNNSSKFNKIFSVVNSKELLIELVYAMYAQITNNNNAKYVGLYRSGALLASRKPHF